MRPQVPTVQAVLPYLREMSASGIFSNHGPLAQRLEVRLSEEILGVPPDRVAVCASGTIALQGACFLAPAERFRVPSFTFPATPLAALASGSRVVLAAIDRDSWWVAPADVPEATGVVAVAPFGASLRSAPLMGDYPVIYDLAASIGNIYGQARDLADGSCAILSLHATKVLGVGEGGAYIGASREDAERFRAWINFGFAGQRVSRTRGTNGKMSEAAAAYGLAALDQWRVEVREWEAARRLTDMVDAAFGIGAPACLEARVSPYWIVQFTEPSVARGVELALAEAGISTRRWWGAGCHFMPALSELEREEMADVEWVAATTVGLPMYRGLTEAAVDSVARILSRFVQ